MRIDGQQTRPRDTVDAGHSALFCERRERLRLVGNAVGGANRQSIRLARDRLLKMRLFNANLVAIARPVDVVKLTTWLIGSFKGMRAEKVTLTL